MTSNWKSDSISQLCAGHGLKKLRRRKGNVQEKAEPLLRAGCAEFSSERHEVIVVAPDKVVGLEQGLKGRRKGFVDALITF